MNFFDGLFDSFFSSDRLNLVDYENNYDLTADHGQIQEESFNDIMHKKTVLFIGGPKDGKVETVNHPEIKCYIQPEININQDKHYQEKTLVVDKDGKEQWIGWDSDSEPVRTEPEVFIYIVLRLSSNNEYYNIAINKEIYNEIKEGFDSSVFFGTTISLRFYRENISNKLDTIIEYTDIIANDKCRIKGLYERISETNSSTVTFDRNCMQDAINDLYIATTTAGYGFQPRTELEESDFNSRIVRSTPELEQEQNSSDDN